MILLHRLFAHNFKQLTDVTLHLPAAGAVLIEGNNEAGKSSLFEAVFFALYGRPLLTDRDYTLTDLRRYGSDALEVELDFSIGNKRFSITRRVGKNHTARLLVSDSNSSEAGTSEAINSLSEVRRRLHEEIRLSDEALLNTCYVEQKRLERLEDLDAANRRATINDLLNLRVLTDLENKFKITRDDRDALQAIKARLEIARLDASLPLLEEQVLKARRAFLYAQALDADERRRAVQQDIDDIGGQQSTLVTRRAEIAEILRQHVSLESRLTALDADISLRLRAWQEALEAQQQSEERLREIETVAAELPQRRAQWLEWQSLAARLAELEALEAEALKRQAEVAAHRDRLDRYSGVLQAWQEGEVQRLQLTEEYDQAVSSLQADEESLQLRQQANERSARLTLFLQHAKALDRLVADTNEVKAREQAAHEEASKLPVLAAQLEALQQAEIQLRRVEEEKRLLERSTAEVLVLEREQEANKILETRRLALTSRQHELEQQAEATEIEKRAHSRASVRAWSTLSLGVMVLAAGILTGYSLALGIAAILLILFGLINVVRASQGTAAASALNIGVLQELNALHGERRALPGALSTIAEATLEARIEELHQRVHDLDKSVRENVSGHDIETLHNQRNDILASQAVAQAAEQMLVTLRHQTAGAQQQMQAETAQLETLARELELAGNNVDSWRQAAQLEQSRWLEEKRRLADSTLHETVERQRKVVAGLQQRQAILSNEQARRRAELDTSSQSTLEAELATADSFLRAITTKLEMRADVRNSLRSLELPTQHNVLQTHLALVEQRLDQAEDLVRQMPTVQQEKTARAKHTEGRWQELLNAWTAIFPKEKMFSEPMKAREQLDAVRVATEQALTAQDASGLLAEDKALAEAQAQLERRAAASQHQQEVLLQDVHDKVMQLGFAPNELLPSLPARLPELAAVTGSEVTERAGVLREAEEAVRESRSRRRLACEALGIDESPLDVNDVEEELATAEQALAVKRRAGEIVVRTRQGIVGRVMPLTMQNMRRLLPLLTDGRYQDAQWDEENNVIAVYDNFARSFQRKRVFSGGARDQISLALRLAFALATLPGEHNIRPGWLFLDEPLSSFDRPRTLALVELLTRGLIRRHFSQIFLVSHSESFDPSQFDYRLRMQAGRVVESTLPQKEQ